MRVVIAGGHGKIALLLSRLPAGRGDTVAGLSRNPDHVRLTLEVVSGDTRFPLRCAP